MARIVARNRRDLERALSPITSELLKEKGYLCFVDILVVCLCAADNVSRALPSRLTRVKQPVIASHIGGPVPGEARCTTPQTHRTRVIPHASCFAVASHTWDCGPGGTRHRSTSRSGHTWSVRPAASAGVCGRPCVAEPLP